MWRKKGTRGRAPIALHSAHAFSRCQAGRGCGRREHDSRGDRGGFDQRGISRRIFQRWDAGVEAFARRLPDLAVLDIGVPRIDGLEICRRLRGLSDTIPIIFVTSREEEFDRVLGLELGADDYLCKPFSMRELMARIKVLFRRSSVSSTASRSDDERPATVGDLTLDPLRLVATWRDVPVPLTVTEFLLLQALARRPGIVKTREQLMQETYPDAISVTDRTIDSHVKRI